MDLLLLLQQTLNGLQLGVMLFLMAAGLTLVFGIMDLINLAHGSFYMLGAYLTASLVGVAGGFVPALALAMLLTALIGVLVEVTALGRLYARDHLYQVLATFGLILFFNELVAVLFGRQPLQLDPPAALARPVTILGAPYPAFRLAIIGMGAAAALFLWWLIRRTRLGMLIRAGADNREMVTALGVDVRRLYTLVFALGCALAALAGGMAGPILSVRIGMGEDILIFTFVVIVIGGIGSVRGAFAGALLVGLADTLARAYLPTLFGRVMERSMADAAGASLGSMTIYVVMALVLAFRPRGLFPARA
jgi:branched-chain amino acid transport system permease protein